MTYLKYKPKNSRFFYFLSGLFLFAAALLLWVNSAKAAAIVYDPYADAVASSSAGVVNADNAVGAPNNTMAQMAGANAILTLDMGDGEEGTQTLRVHFGQINAIVNMTVDFLNDNKDVITSRNVQLGIDPNPSIQNFDYNWTNYDKAYRFVRLSSSRVAASINIDAVEALGYIGSTSTQDTDGDGIPDRSDNNPLVPKPAGNDSSQPPSSTQVNPPPSASNDKDNDGMADSWEKAHGLDPNDKSDGAKDPDNDGLINLIEYKINSNPQKSDSDRDGMPDGWEYDHGLNVNKNDANGDPDGDYLTNLGEYKHNTDPNKADDLYKVFATACPTSDKKISTWEWFWIILLLAGAGLSWIAAWRSRHTTHLPVN